MAKSKKGRLIAGVCASALVVLTVAVILLVHNAGRGTGPEGWPTGALMEGVQPPEQGRIASVHQEEHVVTVYLEAFPESQLAPYLKTLGASPAGDFTYVAQSEGRILAVVYDPAEQRLSLTVTSTS